MHRKIVWIEDMEDPEELFTPLTARFTTPAISLCFTTWINLYPIKKSTERKLSVVILRDQNNYKEWIRSTILALKKVTLWEYVNDFKEKSQLIMLIDKNTLEQQNRMNVRFEKRQKYFEQ